MSRDFQLPPGGKCSFDFPWNNRTSLTAYQAEIQVDGERLRSNEIRPLFCGKAERRPRIDGNLEEFRHLPGIRLGAAQQNSLYQAKIRNSADLGAVVYFQYDDSFFYIAAEVVDDLHQVPHEQPNMYWANDALQLLFVMSGKTVETFFPRPFGAGGHRNEAGGADQHNSPGTEARFLPGGSRCCAPEWEDLLRTGASLGNSQQGVPARQFGESRIQPCCQRQRRQSGDQPNAEAQGI